MSCKGQREAEQNKILKKSTDCTRHGRLAYFYSTYQSVIVLSHMKADDFDSCSVTAVQVDRLREFMGITLNCKSDASQ